MRKGLLTELIGVFEDADEHRREYGGYGAGLTDLREEVLALLREGDRLRRRADRTTPAPPSSGRRAVPEELVEGPQGPPDTTRTPERPGARPRTKNAP